MVMRVIVIVLLAGAAVAALLYSQSRPEKEIVSGTIEAAELRLGSRVGGRVKAVHVEEGETVEQGALLVELEPYDLDERRAQAEAELRARQATLDKLEAGFRPEEVAQAKARLDELQADYEKLKNGPRPQEIAAAAARHELARQELELAQVKFGRTEAAFKKGAVVAGEFDEVTKELRVAERNLEVRREEHELLLQGTRQEELDAAAARVREAEAAHQLAAKGYRAEEIAEARAAVAAAKSALEALQAHERELKILAPSKAVVEAVELDPGDLVSPNAPAISLVNLDDLWVRTYVPENRLDVQVGREVLVTVDSFPGQEFPGRVSFVARQAEFTPGNVQTPEKRAEQVFRIKVRIERGADQLRPGMGVDVWLDRRASAP